MASINPVHGSAIGRKFLELLQWSKGGRLLMVTPFINDFDLRGKLFSERARQLIRLQTSIELIVAPPKIHERHKRDKALSCYQCRGAASKIRLLNLYYAFGTEILIKDGLHAKVYIGENEQGDLRCLTGSVNLTRQALTKWHELGLYVNDLVAISLIESIIENWTRGVSGQRAQRFIEWKRKAFQRYPHLVDVIRKG